MMTVRMVWILACGLALNSAGAIADGGWQPIGTEPSGTAPPRSATQPGSADDDWQVPTWGRGGGWRNAPSPPATSPPTPTASTPAATCAIAVDPVRVQAGEYLTVVVNLPTDIASRVGRMDIEMPDGPASGIIREGNRYRHTWPVPKLMLGDIHVRFTAVAAATGFGNAPVTLCAGQAKAEIISPMRVRLFGPDRIPFHSDIVIRAEVSEGTPPLAFAWIMDGLSVQGTPGTFPHENQSYLHTEFQNLGSHNVSVSVVDQEGRKSTDATRVEVYSCTPKLVSPNRVHVNQVREWSITLMPSDRSDPATWTAINAEFFWGDGTTTKVGGSRGTARATHAFGKAKKYQVTVRARDLNGCSIEYGGAVDVAPKPDQPAPTTRAPSNRDTQCPGGAWRPNANWTCCGPAVCAPGLRCSGPGNCR